MLITMTITNSLTVRKIVGTGRAYESRRSFVRPVLIGLAYN